MSDKQAPTVNKTKRTGAAAPPQPEASYRQVRIRRAVESDIPQVITIDHHVTGIAKSDYWRDIFERYGNRRLDERFFLVADCDPGGGLVGFVIGEVRAWEFGSEPCGWLFALSVDPKARQQHIGEQLFEALSERFRQAGIATMRTMASRDSPQVLAFFRGEGMMAGRYFQLEKSLD